MTDVVAPAGAYRAAIAELPLRTTLVARAAGAVVVVPGEAGWVDAGIAAASAGAVAIVVADPVFTPAADVRRLAEAGIPVVVERTMLRADVVEDARRTWVGGTGWTAPRAAVVDGGAPPAQLPVVVRDALGWLRVLSGDRLSLVAVRGGLALLETGAGIASTLSVVATERPRGWIKALALGEIVTEVDVDSRGTRLVTATAAGRLVAPTRFESSERLAVRRALAAVEAGERPEDLVDLAADAELVERILPQAP